MPQKLKNNWLTAHPLAAVFMFTFICLLPEMLMRDFTPSNELRYLSIADEAISGGHFFAFYNHGVAYADKPPLYLWLVELCRLICGKHCMFALTLLSLIPAFVMTWVMDRWVMSEAPATHRMAMAMMLLTCVMFLGTMVVTRMDMLMCMFIVLALFTFWRMYGIDNDGEPGDADAAVYRKCSWLLPVWIFLALFTKGPVGLLVPPLSITVFLCVGRKWRQIGRYLGWKTWGIIAGLCAVWFAGVLADGGVSYLDNLLFKQTVGRAVNAFTHSRPFWFYAVAILWCIAPYTLILIGSLIVSVKPGKSRGAAAIPAVAVRSELETFFLCIIGTTFVMLSSFSSKLPVYLTPIFPFIVYLFPLAVNRAGSGRWLGWAIGIPAGMMAAAGAAVFAVLSGLVNVNALDALRAEYQFAFSGPVQVAAMLLFADNALAVWFLIRRRSWDLPVFMMGSSLLLMIYAASGVIGKANPYIGYGEMCKEVPDGTQVVTLYIHRPENIDVYVGREIKDYGKDVECFLRDADGDLGKKPLTLITRENRLEDFPALREYVYNAGSVAFVGPYCIVTVIPGRRPAKFDPDAAASDAPSSGVPSGAVPLGTVPLGSE